MNITFAGRTVPCRLVTVGAGYLKLGDFILWRGEVCRVEAVQTECVNVENLSRFVMVTLETRDGRLIPVRAMPKREVFRPVRK